MRICFSASFANMSLSLREAQKLLTALSTLPSRVSEMIATNSSTSWCRDFPCNALRTIEITEKYLASTPPFFRTSTAISRSSGSILCKFKSDRFDATYSRAPARCPRSNSFFAMERKSLDNKKASAIIELRNGVRSPKAISIIKASWRSRSATCSVFNCT